MYLRAENYSQLHFKFVILHAFTFLSTHSRRLFPPVRPYIYFTLVLTYTQPNVSAVFLYRPKRKGFNHGKLTKVSTHKYDNDEEAEIAM